MSDPSAEFGRAMAALGLDGPAAEPWHTGWEQTQAGYPPGGPEFLHEGFIRDTCGRLGLASDACEAVVAALAASDRLPALRRLAWHCHRLIYGEPSRPDPPDEELERVVLPWQARPADLPPWGEMFFAVVLISGGPRMMDFYRRRGIGEDVLRATAGDLERWMRHYRQKRGRWGLAEAGWLASHFLGRIYHLVRLQFRFERFSCGFRAYRDATSGRVVLLAGPGERFRADGQFDGAGGLFDAEGSWTSEFAEGGGIIRGNPIAPDGRALREPVELAAARWRCVLAEGDRVLGMHIPEGGRMDHAACGRSLRQAVAFFRRHFPGYPLRAFVCTSWFLDNQLGRLLPPESNIRRFQEEVHLHPLPRAGEEATFERVFGGPRPADPRQLPRDTLLRRAIAEHLEAGGRLQAGGCVLLPEDLDWGRKVYRRAGSGS